jgi:G2/mitotic-specific cyclin-B, other
MNVAENRPHEKRVFGRELTNLPIYDHIKHKEDQCQPIKPIIAELKMEEQMIDVPATTDDPIIEYTEDIHKVLKSTESKYTPQPNFMKLQTDINERMRAILIDWLIEVHLKFKLLPETLYLTVSLIDRYLERKVVVRQKLQLVGVTAMLVACKYEEIYSPEVKDFVYITDKAYQKEEILAMEVDILQTLEFNITMPSSWRFLQHYSKLIGYEKGIEFYLSEYLIELGLLNCKMLKYTPSMMACGALYLTMKITKKPVAWPTCIKYTENEIRQCAKDLCNELQNNEKMNDKGEKNALRALKKKFSAPKFCEVSKIKLEIN